MKESIKAKISQETSVKKELALLPITQKAYHGSIAHDQIISSNPNQNDHPQKAIQPIKRVKYVFKKKDKIQTNSQHRGRRVPSVPVEAEKAIIQSRKIKDLKTLLSIKYVNEKDMEDPRNFLKEKRI